MIELVYLIFGVFLGILLGLIPGFHINNVLPLLVFIPLTDSAFIFFIISISIAFVFSSFFPSILLGVPNTDTALIVLPGHKLVLEGKAFNGVLLCLYGGLLALFFSLIILFFFSLLMPILYFSFKSTIPYVLVLMILILIFTGRILPTLLVIILSGVLGYLTFNFNLLLPLLTGFFGLSTLLISLSQKTELPKQELKFSPSISKFAIIRSAFLSSFLGSIFNTLPAISSSITALLGKIFGRMNLEEFLVFTGGTNMTYMIFSFLAFVLIGTTRSGSAVFLSHIFNGEHLLFLLGITLVSGVLAWVICIEISPFLINFYQRVKYRHLTLIAISFLLIVVTLFTGLLGLLVLFTSTSIGIVANFLKVRRVNCMAALIIPTILVLL